MDSARDPDELSSRLSRKDYQLHTLQTLVELAAVGVDVSPAAERVVRHCLFSSTGITPQILSLSLDVLIASPSHPFWVDTLSVLVENLKRRGTAACFTALSKLPTLPHAALQHLSLYATTPLLECLSLDKSPAIRKAAVHAVSTFALRSRPLTASMPQSIRLEPLKEDQFLVVRRSIERLLLALITAVFDTSDQVAVSAVNVLTQYATEANCMSDTSVLNASKRAAASNIWDILIPNCTKVADRFHRMLIANNHSSSAQTAEGGSALENMQNAVKGLSRMAAYVLSEARSSETESDLTEQTRTAMEWATAWIDRCLLKLCNSSSFEVASCSCSSVLMICSYAESVPSLEKVANWGIHAIRGIVKVLSEFRSQNAPFVMSDLLRDAVHALAALSKNDYVTSKFVTHTVIGVLPFVLKCPGKGVRLETMSVIASTAIEYDLSGRDVGIGASLKAILDSGPCKAVMASSGKDSDIAAELLCSFSQSLLEASRKIFACQDAEMRLSLAQTWAILVSQVMMSSVHCLKWSASASSAYAKELYLKLFDALGQYSAFTMRSQGMGLEEYERLQEVLVEASLQQRDVGTRASLLACITRYWLTSGMKAESNAGHLLKAIWKHAQEHFRDEEILINELKTGALWSEARQGRSSVQDPMTEGGYTSFATAFTKRSRALFETVGTSVTNMIESAFFESIALSTAASEGSTLITDYIYSSLSALLSLVRHNPPLAERGLVLLKRYMRILTQAESADFIALEAVRNTVSGLEMYRDEFFPKPVASRSLENIMSRDAMQIHQARDDPLAWMSDITESCVFASSRIEDASKGSLTVATEETVLHAAANARKRLSTFRPSTMQKHPESNRGSTEGDQQLVSGASDPFGVTVSHSMDTVKGLALLLVEVMNRSSIRVANASLVYSAAAALIPLPDAPSMLALGVLGPGVSSMQRITLAVQNDRGYSGKVFFSVQVSRQGSSQSIVEQNCVPYYVPSSDVLLLRMPTNTAGVDVFRRRWDLMRQSLSFHVYLDKRQSVDEFVDVLQRRSNCLKQVGRMRTYSHVCALVADSTRGDYVALAALAPEAKGVAGSGPCLLYVKIRSNSEAYNVAFRDECKEWLSPRFQVIFPDQGPRPENEAFALRPQDAYFIVNSKTNLTPYQRWRSAQAIRATY